MKWWVCASHVFIHWMIGPELLEIKWLAYSFVSGQWQLYMFSFSKLCVLFVRLVTPCMRCGNKMSSPAPSWAPWSLTGLQYQEGKPHCLRNVLNTYRTWLCVACQYTLELSPGIKKCCPLFLLISDESSWITFDVVYSRYSFTVMKCFLIHHVENAWKV